MNVSRSKQASLAENRRLGRLASYLVPGWRLELHPERIVPDPTLLGSLQRGQCLTYRCRRRDCGRRVEPDLEALVRTGQGHMSPGDLARLLTCRYPLGCELQLFSETYPASTPLVAHLGDASVLISVRCDGCGVTVTRGVAETIDRLRAARRGGPDTGINQVGRRVRGPCRACKGFRFTSSIERLPPRMGLKG